MSPYCIESLFCKGDVILSSMLYVPCFIDIRDGLSYNVNEIQLKLSAASCGESSILNKNKPCSFNRLPCGKPRGMRS
jgi:hypothetical protein